jgi:hypothetical protein
MAFSIPSVKGATLAEIMTVVSAYPVANRLAALTVEDANEVGTLADAAFSDST